MGVATLDRPVVRTRKPRKLDSEGKPMRRLILVLSEKDYGTVTTAINTRVGPLFVRAFGGEKITATGSDEETRGLAVAAICEEWQTGKE